MFPVRRESLFVLGPDGVLVEYKFECSALNGVSQADDASIQLSVIPTIQWGLARSSTSEQVSLFKDIHLLADETGIQFSCQYMN